MLAVFTATRRAVHRNWTLYVHVRIDAVQRTRFLPGTHGFIPQRPALDVGTDSTPARRNGYVRTAPVLRPMIADMWLGSVMVRVLDLR